MVLLKQEFDVLTLVRQQKDTKKLVLFPVLNRFSRDLAPHPTYFNKSSPPAWC